MPRHGPKRILITGSSSGIGAALARVLAEDGHHLALVARRADRLERLAGELNRLGGRASPIVADLARPELLPRLVQEVLDELGGLDVLVNNAGMGLPRYYGDSQPEDLQRQLAVNLAAPLLLTRHALPHLLESKGIIINVGSAIANVANPILGVYGTTKAGLRYWNDALRRELRHRGVRVCHVELGPVETGFFDAVHELEGGDRGLGIDPAPDSLYNAMRDRPPRLLTARPEAVARRMARLVDHPRSRLALERRVVWPFRWVGGVLDLVPGLADLIISAMIQRIDRAIDPECEPTLEREPVRPS